MSDSKALAIEQVLIGGDLSRLSPDQRVSYYDNVCDSLGLNKLTRPLEFITLNGKLVLYARKDCADQLRKLHHVSIQIIDRTRIEDVYVVKAKAILPSGREDESTGAVTVGNLKGDNLANALMKAETKAKRRVTLSVCGLGMLDESELETIRDHGPAPAVRHVEPKKIAEAKKDDDGRSLPAGESDTPDFHKTRFSEAVARWSKMKGADLTAARNDAAKRFFYKGASGLTEQQYSKMADDIDNLIDNGEDFFAWASQAATVV